MSVGNDVVDLDDPEARLEGLHPRWTERVFSAAERAALAASPQRHRLHWALWAAKESAYKARKRIDAETTFSPRAFEVELPVLPEGRGVGRGWVRHRGEAFALEVWADDAFVHAVAAAPGTAGRLLSRVGPARGEPGASVRAAAAAALGRELGLDPAGLRVAGRPPVVRRGARTLGVAVSLSHHGRFVAFALRMEPRPSREAGAWGEDATRPRPAPAGAEAVRAARNWRAS